MGAVWVFLDVDGVLNDDRTEDRTPNGFAGLDEDKVALLADFVHEVGAKVVLTSTWKDRDLWARDLNPGADLTYLLCQLSEHDVEVEAYARDGDRGSAVREWLDGHPGNAVIFDDHWKNSFRAAGVARFLVQTTIKKGLQPKHIRQAKRLLEQQRRTMVYTHKSIS